MRLCACVMVRRGIFITPNKRQFDEIGIEAYFV